MLATSTQCLVQSCHHKAWQASAGLYESYMEQIYVSLRITTNIINLLRAVERYFGVNANYAKGKGAKFMNWMKCYHPTAYLYDVSRACGGSCQDIGVEGAIAVIMNVAY